MNTNNNYPMIDYTRDFIRVGKQLFKEYGFQYSNKFFYRKNNRIFQAFNLSVPGCIALTIVPFWCDLKAGGIYDNLRLSVAICDGVFKPSSFLTDYYNTEPSYFT